LDVNFALRRIKETSFNVGGRAHRTKTTMTSVKELKKAKRIIITITKSLTALAGRLWESKPDRTGIKAVLEGIEERN